MFKEALLNYDITKVNQSQIDVMLMIWPKESVVEDLLKEELQENESWDKGEAYMIKLAEPASICNRLKVWKFLGNYLFLMKTKNGRNYLNSFRSSKKTKQIKKSKPTMITQSIMK